MPSSAAARRLLTSWSVGRLCCPMSKLAGGTGALQRYYHWGMMVKRLGFGYVSSMLAQRCQDINEPSTTSAAIAPIAAPLLPSLRRMHWNVFVGKRLLLLVLPFYDEWDSFPHCLRLDLLVCLVSHSIQHSSSSRPFFICILHPDNNAAMLTRDWMVVAHLQKKQDCGHPSDAAARHWQGGWHLPPKRANTPVVSTH